MAVCMLCACGGSSASSSAMPSAGNAVVRFARGAPLLETLIGSQPQDLGQTAYLQLDSTTVASLFEYGTFTPFLPVRAGAHSLYARNDLGYFVGPLKTANLAPGKRYTLIVVGTYPTYSVLTFEEPPSSSNAQLSLYEASPSVPQAAFGSFRASSFSDLKRLGNAAFGNLATVTVGKRVSDFGGYAAASSCPPPTPPNCLTPKEINAFDKGNALPFHSATRLSLFLFDPKPGNPSGPPGPLFGSLDR